MPTRTTAPCPCPYRSERGLNCRPTQETPAIREIQLVIDLPDLNAIQCAAVTDARWEQPTLGTITTRNTYCGGVPLGGAVGQVLVKSSDDDCGVEWTTLLTVPGTGLDGQRLTWGSPVAGWAPTAGLDPRLCAVGWEVETEIPIRQRVAIRAHTHTPNYSHQRRRRCGRWRCWMTCPAWTLSSAAAATSITKVASFDPAPVVAKRVAARPVLRLPGWMATFAI